MVGVGGRRAVLGGSRGAVLPVRAGGGGRLGLLDGRRLRGRLVDFFFFFGMVGPEISGTRGNFSRCAEFGI